MNYDPFEIRTGNMRSDGSTDLHFDENEDPSHTQQQFAKECDVNNIVRSNSFMPADLAQLRYQDVSEIGDYHTALSIVTKAQDSFSGLPADVRAQFDNDVAKYVDYVTNPENASKASKAVLSAKDEAVLSEVEKPLATPAVTA